MKRERAMADRHYRSIAKAISWRVVGTIDTMIIAYFITGQMKWAATIGGVEVFSKFFLFYAHERMWTRVRLGQTEAAPAPVRAGAPAAVPSLPTPPSTPERAEPGPQIQQAA